MLKNPNRRTQIATPRPFLPQKSLSSAITYYLKQYSCIFGQWLVLCSRLNYFSRAEAQLDFSPTHFSSGVISFLFLIDNFSCLPL